MTTTGRLDDLPVSFGLATTVLINRLMTAAGKASARVRALKATGAAASELEAAEAELDRARTDYAASLRLRDDEARERLEREGVVLCRC